MITIPEINAALENAGWTNINAIGIYQQYNNDETKAMEELIADLRSWL